MLYIYCFIGTIYPSPDTWTGEGDWGEFYLTEGSVCSDRSPPLGYFCDGADPRHISWANHPTGLYAQPTRGMIYANPAGAVVKHVQKNT